MIRSMSSSSVDHPAEGYISGVISGEVVACRWLRLMCQRHRRDLADGVQRGLHFDTEAAQHVIDFFRFLKHSKGEWAKRFIELEPWQQACLWVLFGWYKADGTRRFRTSYWEIARKNGKSTIAAGVGLYLMVGDGEPGAEVYSAATKRDQARLTHSEATRMVKASPALRKRVTTFRDNLHIRDTATKFEPLGRDADTMDGLNVHAAIVDELHAHRSDEVWGVLETATGSRRQPLMFGITTAGFNQDSFCFQLRDYALKVLEGIVVDDSFFGVIFSLDEGDDWTDPANWPKANPNLGISVKLEDLRNKALKAREIGSALTHFLTKHLNIWTRAAEIWLAPDKWKACGATLSAFDEEDLAGRPCYGGLDLSNTLDITALVWVFPPWGDDEFYRVLPRFWVPEETIREKSRNERIPYDAWLRDGLIEATPGEVIDYEFIYAQVDRDAQRFDVKQIGFDRWGAADVYLRMAKAGIEMVQIGQGSASMSMPMKELEKLIVSKRLAHGDNPVLTWMAHNLVAVKDAAGNVKPDKKRSRSKIDGMVALIMGIDRAVRFDPVGDQSVYEQDGIFVL
jgi:phage terminase large subunit-like protein